MTPIEKLISYFTQQLSLQQTSNIKYTTEGALIDAIDVCKNALKVEKQYAQQIASLAWDAAFNTTTKGWNSVYPFTRGYQGATDAQKKAYDRTKEQFLNSIFNPNA